MQCKLNCAAGVVVLTMVTTVAGWCGQPDEGLIAHWTFQRAADGLMADVSGHDHPARQLGGLLTAEGPSGASLLCSAAADDNLELATPLDLSATDELTIVAVVRARSFQPPDAANRANSRNGILGSDDSNVIFGLTDLGRVFFVWDAAQDQYQTIAVDREAAIAAGCWCQVAVTRRGRVATLYVNGIARQTEKGLAAGPFMPTGTWRIGRVNGSPRRDFDGWIDDLRVYRRALTPGEVGQLAAACGRLGQTAGPPLGSQGLERLQYGQAGRVVDLGVGLWAQPLPMDYDGDGDWDLVVSCADVPYNGVYLFENPGGGNLPVFRPAVRIGPGRGNVQVSQVGGSSRVLGPAVEFLDFSDNGWGAAEKMPLSPNVHSRGRIRANQWKLADYNGDGRLDVIIGIGDWADYGWDNAFDTTGKWTRGPLHGFVYAALNEGSEQVPRYGQPFAVTAAGEPVDVFGMPSPNFADFDQDGDLDLLCGEFVDTFTYFENTSTRTAPEYAAGRPLKLAGQVLRVDLCMHVDAALDWDRDGDPDLVVGQEDGRVMWLEHLGRIENGVPQFAPPRFFQQQAEAVKFGALVTPCSVDWDGDGDEDLVCGNTAGYIGLIENIDGKCPPAWAPPRLLEVDGQPIRIEAGPNGSIQGPCEAKWGYTTLSVADWDHDGLLDIVANSIWGRVVWFRNVGSRARPALSAAQPIRVQWPGPPPKPAWNWWNPQDNELATQWRTTPVAIDWDQDGLNDLVMLDHEGYLAWFQRRRIGDELALLPGVRMFVDGQGQPLRLNDKTAGGSGRRKLCFADWDQDGVLDLLVNSRNVDFFRGKPLTGGRFELENQGSVDTRRLAGHTTSPTVVDWDRNGIPDLLVGAEDGFLYYLRNPRSP